MPKAILTFKLPEEQDDFDKARQGADAHSALWDFGNVWLREQLKWNENLSAEQREMLERTAEKFWEIVNSRGIEL